MGIFTNSLANIALSDRIPFIRLMSDTCIMPDRGMSHMVVRSPGCCRKSAEEVLLLYELHGEGLLTVTLYRIARPARVSVRTTCAERNTLCTS